MNIKKDDKVVVLSGKDKGKQGKILVSDPKAAKVIVEGVNVATKHQKPRKQGRAKRAASSRSRPPSMPPRFSSSAPSAARPPASATRSRVTRRFASARSAARKSERKE